MIQHPGITIRPRPFSSSQSLGKLSTQPRAQFGGAQSKPLAQTPPAISRMLKHFDFTDIGNSHVKQIQLVYAGCILWRIVAANERRKASPTQSYNEIRESILRDSVGYAFWFFGTPMLQRLYLASIPQEYGKALMMKNPADSKAKGLWQQAKTKIKAWNPISGYAVPSSQQVKDLRTQALQSLKGTGIQSSEEAYQRVEHFYNKLVLHRNMATGIGLISTILLLGIGINYLNFYLTQKNMEQRNKALQKPKFPTAPNLPSFRPPQPLAAPAAPSSSVAPVWPPVATPFK